MCRFTLYLGPAIRLGKLLIEPKHSLIHQSAHANERKEPLNGDGFGVGWYAPRLSREPAVFHSVSPAWNNRNLTYLARVIATPCVLAHVRAASPGSVVDLCNCHPFAWGRYLLMHNGLIGGFPRVRRRLLEEVGDEAFSIIKGSTDTEHMFAIFVDQLLRHERADERCDDPALALAQRLSDTLQRVVSVTQSAGEREPNYLNVAVSNGTHAVVSRFTDDPDSDGDSLYHLRGNLYETTAKEFGDRAHEDRDTAVVVSSERLTGASGWQAVPRNHMMVVTRGQAPRLFPLSSTGALQLPQAR